MLCVPLFLGGVFDFEELHTLNRGPKDGLSSCRLGCHLGSRFGLAAAPLRHMLRVPLFLTRVFDFEELHMLINDHLNY